MHTSIALLALALIGSPLCAQTTAVGDTQAPPPAVDSLAARARIPSQLELIKLSGAGGRLPPADSFTIGNRLVRAGAQVTNPVGVSNGTLDVYGTIQGNAIAIQGDIRLHPGAEITGDAIAVGGRVSFDGEGGRVDGEIRSLSTLLPAGHAPEPAASGGTWRALKLVTSWFAILLIIGIGTMIFAEHNFDGVVLELERGVGRSFLAGLVGQVVALPVLLLLLVALAITIIGLLLIPFAIVAFVIAMMGLITLGFLAVARLTGSFAASERGTTGPRGVNLHALLVGIAGYMALWALAAGAHAFPMTGTVLRGIALGVTWVAATVGLGATLLSRAGTQRAGHSPRPRTSDPDDLTWQTPTPVAGVAAARRSASREPS